MALRRPQQKLHLLGEGVRTRSRARRAERRTIERFRLLCAQEKYDVGPQARPPHKAQLRERLREVARMSSILGGYNNKKIIVLTTDGRTLVGTLVSYDSYSNLVLDHTVERVIRPADDPDGSSVQDHGVYLVRGDLVLVVGLVDEEVDARIDWTAVHGEMWGDTKHAS